MESRVVDNPQIGRFELLADGAVAGFAEYERTGSTVSFTHTVIDSDFEGRGLGSVLAHGALDAVRNEGSSVLPFCPFIEPEARTAGCRDRALVVAVRRT
jgi:predicted GNAT family acetyltransferase